jgi:hypothetical protein
MASNAAHAARRRVVHDAPKHLHIGPFTGPTVWAAFFRRRNSRFERFGRQKHRVLHLQRLEYFFP